MHFFGDGGLIMLYQLYRLLRDDRESSHPPTLSPGAGKSIGFQPTGPVRRQ